MENLNLKGMIPAAVLPMTEEYSPDYKAYADYIEWLISEKAIAIAVNMDTGEGPQLSRDEQRQAVQVAVEASNGRVPILAAVMGGTTQMAVDSALSNKESGADGLVVFPNAGFRNDPLDPTIPHSFHKAIADATDLPLVLFQLAPVFGGVNYTQETLLSLLEIPHVVALKEASFDAEYFAYTKETLDISGRTITLLTGNDRFITESIVLGAEGALLGFAAIGCRLVADMLEKANAGDMKAVVDMRHRLHTFATFIYKDPILDYRARCKAALALVGVYDWNLRYVRPPLLSVKDEERVDIKDALTKAGML